MDGDLASAEAKGQINIAWGQRGKEDGGRDGKQGAVCYIPALPPAQGAAQVQVAKWSWSCAAQNFGDFGHSPYLGLGAREGRGKRGRALPMAEGLGWAPGSVLGRHRHNHALERKPAIKLTAQITDFCLYNYTQLLSVHSLRHRRIYMYPYSQHSLEMRCVWMIRYTCLYIASTYLCIKMCKIYICML